MKIQVPGRMSGVERKGVIIECGLWNRISVSVRNGTNEDNGRMEERERQ